MRSYWAKPSEVDEGCAPSRSSSEKTMAHGYVANVARRGLVARPSVDDFGGCQATLGFLDGVPGLA